MTIKNRNILILTGIVLSFILFVLGVFLFVICIMNPGKISGFLPDVAIELFGVGIPFKSIWAAMGAGLFLGLGGLVSSIFVINLFQKTQTPEISFYIMFSVSSVLEVLRLVFPLQLLYSFSPDLLINVSRILLFSRFLGMLALAGAGIFSSKNISSQVGKIISTVIVISFFFSISIPLDTRIWTEFLIHRPGYLSLFFVLFALCGGAAFFSFYFSSETQTSGEFRKAAWGMLFLFCGYLGLMLPVWVPVVLVSVFLYILGTILVIKGIYQYYLWN